MKKTLHEDFTKFFESPTRDGFRVLMQNHFGEQDFLDFKSEWPEMSKMARHMLAIANSGGGLIVIGVTEENESLEANGVKEKLDKAQIDNKIKKYVSLNLEYEVLDFTYSASEYESIKGKSFQVVFVEYDETHIPYISKSDGIGIKKNMIYIRRGTKSEEASYEELQNLINSRIETQYSSQPEIKLEEHLSQLKLLYTHVRKYSIIYPNNPFKNISGLATRALYGEPEEVVNSHYPLEGYDAFISRMIDLKKNRIERLLDQ